MDNLTAMHPYIGTKLITARPMTRGAYNEYRGWTIPADENPEDEGYLVKYSDNYVSWSPKDAFDEAYRPTNAMNFGLAIEAAKKGKKIARLNWNGKGQYVFLAHDVEFHTNADLSAFADTDVEVHDLLVIKTSQDIFQPGWLATQSDILADDWYIYTAG